MPLPMTEKQAREFLSRTHYGHDPYEKRYRDNINNFTTLPHCLHFYYMGLDGAKEDYRHYYHDNGRDAIQLTDVPGIMRKLARNAAYRDHNPPSHGRNFDDIYWRRRCYVAVVMDSDLFSFWEDAGMRFVQKDGGQPNLSFFDADDFPIEIEKPGGTITRTGFFCINHMKRDEVGNNLLPTDTIFHSYEFGFRIGGGNRPWYYDPGGTNQGPPETP